MQRSEACPWAVPVIVKQLIPDNGTPDFDSLTKTKTVEKITILADEEGLSEIVGDLKMILVDPLGSKGREGAEDSQEQQVKTAEVRRQWAANQMLSLIRKGKSAKAASWIGGVVTILAGFGHLESPIDGIEIGSAVSVANQEMFRSRLLSCLTHLIFIKDIVFDDKTWPYWAVQSILQSKDSPPRRLVMELDDTIESAIRSAQEALGKINKKV
jgi:DNA polymerase phi